MSMSPYSMMGMPSFNQGYGGYGMQQPSYGGYGGYGSFGAQQTSYGGTQGGTSATSPYAQSGGPVYYTSLGPSTTPGGFSGANFGTPGLPYGFGFPSFGDPLFYTMPAASSFFMNRLLGFANGSAVNVNFGPVPSTLGFGGLLLGSPFFADGGNPGTPSSGSIFNFPSVFG